MVHYNQSFAGMDLSDRERERMSKALLSSDGNGGHGMSQEEIVKQSGDLFEKGMKEMSHAKVGETKKIFGFNIDAGLVSLFSSIYSNASYLIFNKIAPGTHKYAKDLSAKAGIASESKQARIAAVATMGVALVLKAGKNISEIYSNIQTGNKEQHKAAGHIAPVLDEIKGRHSVRAFASVSESQNEVIYAHRQRIRRLSRARTMNSLTGFVLEAIPNLVLDIPVFRGMWAGKNPGEATEAAQQEKIDKKSNMGLGENLLGMVVNTSTGPISQRIQATNEVKLRQSLQPYSALEMILELAKQVESKPDSRSFKLPRDIHNPKGYQSDLNLEQYIAKICIQHQADMAALNPEHSEIREALKEDLMAAVKPIAAAIRGGDLSAMALIRLVGEGKIIKKYGRSIADADDVAALLEKNASKQSHYVHVDPVEHYKDSSYSRAQFKESLNALEGDERRKYAMLAPDTLLLDAGMDKHSVASIHAAAEKAHDGDAVIAKAILGASASSPEELKEKGLASSEIKKLNKAGEAIERGGVKAVHDLKTSPANPHGVEQLVLNLAVPQLAKGDKEYFGKLLARGQEKLEEISADVANDNDGEMKRHGHKNHQKSHSSYAEREYARDHYYSHEGPDYA